MSATAGWLELDSDGRRYFVLQHSKLVYFETSDVRTATALGSFDLLQVVNVLPSDEPSWTLEVTVRGGRTYRLRADCEADRQKWLEVLAMVADEESNSAAAVVPRGQRGGAVPMLGKMSLPTLASLGTAPSPRPVSPRKSAGAAPASPRAGTPRHDLKEALEGEKVAAEINYVVVLSASENVVARGTVFVTNFRVAFVPDLNCQDKRLISIPFGRVRGLQEQTLFDKLRNSGIEYSVVTLTTSDAQIVCFGFSKKTASHSLAQFSAAFQSACPAYERAVFAFARYAAQPSSGEGWDLYDPHAEFKRAGWPSAYRLSTVNSSYKICESYPAAWVVPASVTDDDLAASASFRSHGRVVACVWYDKDSKACLARCSQPAVGIANNRSLPDERIIHCVLEAAGTGDCQELQLFDARPKRNALANKAAKGAGYENVAHLKYCSLTFLNIENIHVVRGSWLALVRSCADDSDDSGFYSAAAAWLSHVGVLLQGSLRIAQALTKGTPCLVHCSDGWDRTPQLCCLVMLLNDGHFRTMRGFASMIESQWVAFGHQFALRQGWFSRGESESAPIFNLFIDCVFQALDQFRDAFEFSEEFLLALLDGLDALSFGTFLGHEKVRQELDLRNTTLSIWPPLFGNPKHVNRSYVASSERLEPSTTQRSIKLWRRFYLRYSTELGSELTRR